MDLQELRQKLDPAAKEAMDEFGVPGVAVGIRIDGENHAIGYGTTNIEFGVPVDGDTLFQIGSTSKTFTATAIMRLVEEGKLSLDDRVTKHLPNFQVSDPEVSSNVTIRHLITHMPGWMGDWTPPRRGVPSRGDDALRRRVGTLKKVPQLAPLGAVWSYNNAAFTVLGHLVEKVSKMTFERAITEWIFEPLGMEHSFYFPEQILTHKTALGHVKTKEGEWRVVRPWASARATGPSGGIASSAADQMTYAQFHLGQHPEGKNVLSPDTAALMQQPLERAVTVGTEVGICWLLDEVNGVRTVSHGGTMVGQTSAFMMVPERDFAVTVLTNAGDEGKQVHRRLTKWALKELLGLERPVPETVPLSENALRELSGAYTYYRQATVDVTSTDEGYLNVEWKVLPKELKKNPALVDGVPKPATLRPIGDLLFIVEDGLLAGQTIDFVRGADGAIGWIRIGGRMQPRVS